MARITATQAASQEAAILAAAERIVIDRGWDGLNVRSIQTETGVSRTVVSQKFKGVALKESLISAAFSYVRSIVPGDQGSAGIHIVTLRDRVLDLFRTTPNAVPLMVRCSSDARVVLGAGVSVSMHFFKERAATVDHIRQRCGLPELAVEELVDWYVAAATILQTTNVATIDDLPAIGRFGFSPSG